MKKILLAGYYGFGNLGDEAILEMVLEQVLEITNKDNITVLSGNKATTNRKYNIDTIHRYDVFSIIRKLKASYILVFGGGSLLQDVTSKRSIYYYLFLIRLAKLMGNKVVMLSQGIGPLVNENSKRSVAKTLNMVDYITVRDKYSKVFLGSIGVNINKVYLSADPVICLRDNENYENNNDNAKRVCFSLRNWKGSDVGEKISSITEMLINNGIECYFIPFYYDEDLELILNIEKKIGNRAIYYKEKLSTNEAYDIIKNMNLLVGVRLHSLIFAATANVPFVAVSYDQKVDQFANSLNMSVACNIDNIDSDLLFEEIKEKLENEKEEKKELYNEVINLRESINVNYEILKKI